MVRFSWSLLNRFHFQMMNSDAASLIFQALGKMIPPSRQSLRRLPESVARTENAKPGFLDPAGYQHPGFSESIEPEVGLSRYPGIIEDALWLPAAEYTAEDAGEARDKVEKVLPVARSFVEDWFRPSG
jgi:HEPN domain-containing protein